MWRPSWAGLRAVLALVLGLGLCGVPYSGPDVGGFTGSPSPELYLRWFQLGAYLPLFRTHSAIDAGRREPWEFGPEVLEHARAALAERTRLLPYLETLAHIAHRTGAPYVRPLWWKSPGDRALRDCGDAFLLGDALLVAPVLEQGAVRRPVRLPRGLWYDTATGAAHRGRSTVVLDAPLGRIPVLARAGSVLPVAGPDGAVELEAWAPRAGAHRRRGGRHRRPGGLGGAAPRAVRVPVGGRGGRGRAGRRRPARLPRCGCAGLTRPQASAREPAADREGVQREAQLGRFAQQLVALGLVGRRGRRQCGGRAGRQQPEQQQIAARFVGERVREGHLLRRARRSRSPRTARARRRAPSSRRGR